MNNFALAKYYDSMHKILNDSSKFEKINTKVPKLKDIEREVKELISDLEKAGIITEKESRQMKPKGSNYPTLYGSPKVHKLDLTQPPSSETPVRPILSMVNSQISDRIKERCNSH